MITNLTQLAALRAMSHEQLVGEVLDARLKQANAELLLRDAVEAANVRASSQLLARLMGVEPPPPCTCTHTATAEVAS